MRIMEYIETSIRTLAKAGTVKNKTPRLREI